MRHVLFLAAVVLASCMQQDLTASSLELRLLAPVRQLCAGDCRLVRASVPEKAEKEWWVHKEPDLALGSGDLRAIVALPCPSADGHCWKAVVILTKTGTRAVERSFPLGRPSGWVAISHRGSVIGTWPTDALLEKVVLGPFSARSNIADLAGALRATYAEGPDGLIANLHPLTDPYGDVDLERVDRLLDQAEGALNEADERFGTSHQ